MTGGGKGLFSGCDLLLENDLVATARAANLLYPGTRGVIEMARLGERLLHPVGVVGEANHLGNAAIALDQRRQHRRVRVHDLRAGGLAAGSQ